MRRQGHADPSATTLSIPPHSSSTTSSSSLNNNDNDEEDHKYHHYHNDAGPAIQAPPISSFSPPFFRLTIFLVTTTASAVCYYSTLEGGETEQWLHARLYGMAMWMLVSDVLFTLSIMIALSMVGKWRRGALFYAVTSILCMFALDQGNTVQHHGAYVFFFSLASFLFSIFCF